MQDFDKELNNLLQSIQKLPKAKRKEKHKKIETLITNQINQIDQTQDFSSFLLTIENQLKRYYSVAAKGIVDAFSNFSENKKKIFLEILLLGHERTLIYHITVRILMVSFNEGMNILSNFCTKITDDGKKVPTKDILNKLKSALLSVPELEEKPLKIILNDGSIDKNLILSIMPILLDSTQQKKRYPLLKEKLILHTAAVWEKLSEKDQYNTCIRCYLKGKYIDSFFVNKDYKNRISKDFIHEFFLDPKKDNDISDNKVPSFENVSGEKPPEKISDQAEKKADQNFSSIVNINNQKQITPEKKDNDISDNKVSFFENNLEEKPPVNLSNQTEKNADLKALPIENINNQKQTTPENKNDINLNSLEKILDEKQDNVNVAFSEKVLDEKQDDINVSSSEKILNEKQQKILLNQTEKNADPKASSIDNTNNQKQITSEKKDNNISDNKVLSFEKVSDEKPSETLSDHTEKKLDSKALPFENINNQKQTTPEKKDNDNKVPSSEKVSSDEKPQETSSNETENKSDSKALPVGNINNQKQTTPEKKDNDISDNKVASSEKVSDEKPQETLSNQTERKSDSKALPVGNMNNQKQTTSEKKDNNISDNKVPFSEKVSDEKPQENENRIINKKIYSDSITYGQDILNWFEKSPVQEVRKLLDQLEELKNKEVNWQEKNENASKEKASLKQMNENLSAENRSLNNKLQEMNIKIEKDGKKIASLKQKNEDFSAENHSLINKNRELNEEIDKKNNEIKEINNQIQIQNNKHKEKMVDIGKENDQEQKRKIQEMKNKIALELQHDINNFYSLNESDNLKRSELQLKIFNNIVDTLNNSFEIKVNKRN